MSIVSSLYIMNPKTDSNSTLHAKYIKSNGKNAFDWKIMLT